MPKDPKPPLAYERSGSGYVTRRSFYLLLAFTLANFALSAHFVYYPRASAYARGAWQRHLENVARAKAARAQLALERQCLDWTDPPGAVAWDEYPQSAAALLAAGNYDRDLPVPIYRPDYAYVRDAWPPAAKRPWPRPLLQLLGMKPDPATSGSAAVVFLHARKTPSGPERLVAAQYWSILFLPDDLAGRASESWAREVNKWQTFSASSYALDQGRAPPAQGNSQELDLHALDTRLALPFRWTPPAAPGGAGTVTFTDPAAIRVYAGRPDPSDPSHFTIDYDLAGKHGTIDGYLRDDDAIDLKPRTGTVTGRQWRPDSP